MKLSGFGLSLLAAQCKDPELRRKLRDAADQQWLDYAQWRKDQNAEARNSQTAAWKLASPEEEAHEGERR